MAFPPAAAMEQQEQQAQSSTATNVDSAIPDSAPSQTDRLWSAVTTASRSDTQDGATTDYVSTTIKSADCDDEDYEITALRPRGVKMIWCIPGEINENPFYHFQTKIAPESGKVAHYQKLLSPEIDQFIDGGPAFNERLEAEYKTGRLWRYSKRRWINLAITFLFRQDVMNRDRKKTGLFMAERKDEELIESFLDWFTPPILAEDDDTKPCDFKLFTDIAYWLSLQAFKGTWKSVASYYTCLYRDRTILPYLSVAFEQDPWDSSAVQKAVNRMASAATISQFNRYHLRERMKKETEIGGVKWSTADDAAIRHYGMIICGHKWEVYLATPRVAPHGEWMGTDIKKVDRGNLDLVEGVKECVNWINEIHLWGLGEYAQNVRADIESLAETSELTSRRLRGQ